MTNTFRSFGFALFAPLMLACSGSGSTASSSADSDAAADTIDMPALLSWKASQNMAIYPDEIDSIIAYFEKADRWTAIHLANITDRRQFDSIEAAYLAAFPYIEDYSMILEQYASIVSPEQMNRLEATALSMGRKVDSAATAAGIDPATVNPFNTAEPVETPL